MLRKAKQILDNQSGAALIFVLLALVIVSIIGAGIASLVHENLMQAKAQEDEMKAYYLSISGSDLCFAALLQENYDAYGVKYTLLSKEFTTEAHSNPASTPQLTDTLGEADGLEGGSVQITVSAFDKSDGERWVQIVSTATLDSSSVTKKTTLQFQASNPLVQYKF